MSVRPLRLEQALRLLPRHEDLIPLREAMIGGSRVDEGRVWTASEAYGTLESRIPDADRLESEISGLAARVKDRIEQVYRHVLAAVVAYEQGDAAGAARALVLAGETEEEAGRLEAAEGFYERAAELGRRPRDRRVEGLALRRLARTAWRRGRLERAIRLYRRGFAIADAERDSDGKLVACLGMGNVLTEQGRWADAEEWYRRGLELVPAEPPTRTLWQLESNLSGVTRRSGRLDESEEWVGRARLTVERLGDTAGRVYVYNAEGLLALARGDVGRAEAAYREALRYAASPVETARVLVNLAEALLERAALREAESVTRHLEQIAVTHTLIASLPYAYRSLGGIARIRGDEDGFVFFEQALELCRDEPLPELELAVTQHEYARFEVRFGRVESARARLREALRIYEAIGTKPESDRARADLSALPASNQEETERER
jgi:tetratricopeptide (TPR) repeat protein